MDSSHQGAFLRLVSLLAFGGLALPVALAVFLREDQHARLGEEITHDAFAFRVDEVELLALETAGPGRPRKEYTIVHLSIANRAKRLPFDLGGWTPVLVDGAGVVHAPHPGAQRLLARERGAQAELRGALERGAAIVKLVAFDVPAGARDLRLEIRWGEGVVNALEDFVFGSRTLSLEVGTSH